MADDSQNNESPQLRFPRRKKRKNLPSPKSHDHSKLFDSLTKTTKGDGVKYLYADPVFLTQTEESKSTEKDTTNNDEDKFYDCLSDDSLNYVAQQERKTYQELLQQQQQKMNDIINNVEDPRKFKLHMKEVAYTSHILYRSFKNAYRKAKKAKKKSETDNEASAPNCDKCGRYCSQISHKSRTDIEKPFEEFNICNLPFQVTDVALNATNDMELICEQVARNRAIDQENVDTGAGQVKRNSCDCLEKSQKSKSTDNKLENDKCLDVVDKFNICAAYVQEYANLGCCEKCAKLRDEQPPDIFEGISETTTCPLTSNEIGKDSAVLCREESEAKIAVIEMSALSEPIRSDNIMATETLIVNINPKTESNVPATFQTVTSESTNAALSLKSPPLQPPQAAPLCICAQLSSTKQASQTEQLLAVPPSSCCHQQFNAAQKAVSTPSCLHLQPLPSPGFCLQYLRPMPVSHPHTRATYEPSCFCCIQQLAHCGGKGKHSYTSRCNAQPSSKHPIERSSTKTKFVHMEPITFTLPLNLQIQARNGQTRFVQTEVILEAYAEQEKKKHKTVKSTNCETNKTSSYQAANRLATKNVKRLELQTQAAKFGISSDVFYSCSSSSFLETKILHPNKDCESLVEVYDIIKNRLVKDKCASEQILKSLVSSDFEECFDWSRDLPVTPPPTPEHMRPQQVEKNKFFASLETQTSLLPVTTKQKDSTFDRFTTKETMAPVAIDSIKSNSERITHRRDLIEPLPEHLTRRINNMIVDEDLKTAARTGSVTWATQMLNQITSDDRTLESAIQAETTLKPKPTAKVSEAVQTDLSSAQVAAHAKRNEIRIEIIENMRDLLRPSASNTTNKYAPEEIEEILKDLHTIIDPKKADTMTKEESRERVLENIRLLLNSIETHKTISTTAVKKSQSTANTLKDIGHILNPKSGQKPTKHYTKDQRENMLYDLHKLLLPRSQQQQNLTHETRYSIVQDLRFLLDGTSVVQASSLRQNPLRHHDELRDGVWNDTEKLMDSQFVFTDDMESSSSLKGPKPPPNLTPTKQLQSSSDELIQQLPAPRKKTPNPQHRPRKQSEDD